MLAVCALLMAGCGGGGGDAAGDPEPALRLEVINTEQQISLSQGAPVFTDSVDFAFRIHQLSQGGEVYLQGQGTENGVRGADIFQRGAEDFVLRLFLQSPDSLAVGEHLDTVSLSACLDAQCQRPISGSPATLRLRYRVEAAPPPPPPPPRLSRLDLSEIKIQELSSGTDFGSNVYASLAEDSAVGAGTVMRFQVVDEGRIEKLTLLPRLEQPPGALAHNYSMLFVALPGTGRIERIRTDTNIRETTPLTVGGSLLGPPLDALSLSTSGFGDGLAAIRAGADGSPDSLAYYRGDALEGRAYGGNFLQPFDANVLAMDPSEQLLVGLNTRQPDYTLHRFSLSSEGPSSEGRIANVGAGAGERLVWSVQDNYLYSDRGRVYNPQTGELIKQLDDPALIASTLHASLYRLISLSKGAAADETILRVYALDGSELSLIEEVAMPGLANPRRLEPWGHDGVATIGDDGRLVRLYGPAIRGY